ncbi:MAG: DUF1616 domain-containing protein [Dehalococcoidales bacterium]|jgi:uncharacterized membrane protein|nr:DUF1616 domain-containing protein [Dehalococcoidales bacterium]|tara:strand:- start:331 stop:669 length:339 start_codon:yes stop_codon:yes gene_type:complete
MDWLSPLKELFGLALPLLDKAPLIRATLTFILMFLLPGFAWTLLLFNQLSLAERLALSFGLSLVIVTLSILGLNILFGVKITAFNALMTILSITVSPLMAYYFKRRMSRRSA